MANRRAQSPTPGCTNDSNYVDTLAEMCASIDELRCHNQTFEEDVHNIRKRQRDSNPPKEMEFLDP